MDFDGVLAELANGTVDLGMAGLSPDPERADARSGEVERRRRAEPARAEKQDARVEELHLAVLADLGDEQVPAVAGALRVVEAAG